MNQLIRERELLFRQFRFLLRLDLKKKNNEASDHQCQHPE